MNFLSDIIRLKGCPMSSVVEYLAQISFDEVAASIVACLVVREAMIMALPDRIAGPGGWLIDTGTPET